MAHQAGFLLLERIGQRDEAGGSSEVDVEETHVHSLRGILSVHFPYE